MTFDEVMQELESLGTEQYRKTYKRHGAASYIQKTLEHRAKKVEQAAAKV